MYIHVCVYICIHIYIYIYITQCGAFFTPATLVPAGQTAPGVDVSLAECHRHIRKPQIPDLPNYAPHY